VLGGMSISDFMSVWEPWTGLGMIGGDNKGAGKNDGKNGRKVVGTAGGNPLKGSAPVVVGTVVKGARRAGNGNGDGEGRKGSALSAKAVSETGVADVLREKIAEKGRVDQVVAETGKVIAETQGRDARFVSSRRVRLESSGKLTFL